ncbi:hypothetical protein EJB05_48492, partial [Eragrostis curvula]
MSSSRSVASCLLDVSWAHSCSALRISLPRPRAEKFHAHDHEATNDPTTPQLACSAPLERRSAPLMPSMANGDVESSAESPDAEEQQAVPKNSPAAAATKGRGLRRWRRIRREQQRDGYTTAAAAAGGGGDENSSQLHKRRIPLPAGAPKAKHEAAPVEAERSTASVESRFVPPAPESAKLDPGLGFLVASAGFSLGAGGADSDNSEDRSSSRSSTAASAPRVFPRHGHGHGASLHGKNHRAARSRADRLRVHAAAENSRSSVESDVHSSNALKARNFGVGVNGNGVHKGLSGSCDYSDDGQPSEEVRSTAARGYYRENGTSVPGRLVRGSDDSGDDVEDTLDEGSELKEQNGGLQSGEDPYAQSILTLQRTQEALENEIEKIVAIGKKPGDDFDVYDDEWSGSVRLEKPIDEPRENIKHLEFRLGEASALMEKDSQILELGALGQMPLGKTAVETNLRSSESELDALYQEKIEAEIQCIILTAAYETWVTLSGQMALYEAQKSLYEDYKKLELKLRHMENRATMLVDMAEKLEVQCKELSSSSEVLQLQSKASRVSLFCFVQFMLLCVAIITYLMRLMPAATDIAIRLAVDKVQFSLEEDGARLSFNRSMNVCPEHHTTPSTPAAATDDRHGCPAEHGPD